VKSQEHRAVGDGATSAATVDLGGEGADRLLLTFGDVVALSGDFFVADGFPVVAGAGDASHAEALASDGLFTLAAVPGGRGERPGTRDEVICALHVMAADQGEIDPRFRPGGAFETFACTDGSDDSEVERRVRDRFLALGASNDDHFVRPGPRGPATAHDRPPSAFGSAQRGYRVLHQRALDEAWSLGREGGDLSRAMAREAAAQHYLTDAFAAGHLRTPVAAMREYWQVRYPDFWNALRAKVGIDTVAALRALSPPFRLLPPQVLLRRTAAAIEQRTQGYPRITLGDLLAKVFHDWDNTHGLELDGGGRLYGDGCLQEGVTARLALAAVRAGVDDVEVAFALGARGDGTGAARLYDAVRARTGAKDGVFRAEACMPRPSPANPPQNWQAPDFESLWDSPIVGSSGTTVGRAVAGALEKGQELTRRLEQLGHGIAGSVDVPPVPGLRRWVGLRAGQAYQRGFVDALAADPRSAVSACLSTPQRAYAPSAAA
jgi:hypothetical protein